MDLSLFITILIVILKTYVLTPYHYHKHKCSGSLCFQVSRINLSELAPPAATHSHRYTLGFAHATHVQRYEIR